jgi:hypothetical protein
MLRKSYEGRFRRSPDVTSRTIGKETVLLDLRSGRYFGLNASGAVIWEAIGPTGATRETMIAGLTARFEVDVTRATADVDEVVATLEAQGLVVRGDA